MRLAAKEGESVHGCRAEVEAKTKKKFIMQDLVLPASKSGFVNEEKQ